MDGYLERLAQAKGIAEELLNSKRYDFDGLKPSDLQDKLPVVYAIFDKVDGVCLHVGRTKNLRRRLYTNHLMGPEANARLKKYLVKDSNRTDITSMDDAKEYLKKRCCFQYLPVDDIWLRGQIEGLLRYLLDVIYIHEEH